MVVELEEHLHHFEKQPFLQKKNLYQIQEKFILPYYDEIILWHN
jgi:hypothetical protein